MLLPSANAEDLPRISAPTAPASCRVPLTPGTHQTTAQPDVPLGYNLIAGKLQQGKGHIGLVFMPFMRACIEKYCKFNFHACI